MQCSVRPIYPFPFAHCPRKHWSCFRGCLTATHLIEKRPSMLSYMSYLYHGAWKPPKDFSQSINISCGMCINTRPASTEVQYGHFDLAKCSRNSSGSMTSMAPCSRRRSMESSSKTSYFPFGNCLLGSVPPNK